MSIFSKVATSKLKSSNFNLSEEMRLSCNMGDLVPILCKEVLPEDRFKVDTELLIKLAPLKAPVMHRITAYVHYFFVPTFQVNDVFEKFINPKVNSDNSIVMPYFRPTVLSTYGQKDYLYEDYIYKTTGGHVGTLLDYLGLPITQSGWLAGDGSSDESCNILVDPLRCYQHIYNSYYRDQNLEPIEDVDPDKTDLFLVDQWKDVQGNFFAGLGATNQTKSRQARALMTLRKRAWAKDYFTSALPSPQAGDDVLIPISSRVEPDGNFELGNSSGVTTPAELLLAPTGVLPNAKKGIVSTGDGSGNPAVALQYASGLKAVNATATINDLRRAMALQRFKELAERGGSRYSEMVRNFFGAVLKDYWVDRPIYLGGQKQPVKVSEMFQTSQTTETEALGVRAGIGGSYGRTSGVYLNSPCHGYLFGILSIRPEGVYTQGLERMWTRQSIFDWAFPQFANMGEQEIYQRELFADGTDAQNKIVFGYTPRYAEYKVGHGHVAGEFRTSLDYWHFARKFENAPTLSSQFVMMNSVPTRPFNVTDETTEHIYVDLYNNIHARRRLPYFGTPSIL